MMKNNEAAKAARREYHKKWTEKNRAKVNAYHRKWSKQNPDKVKAIQARYWMKQAEGES